MFDNPETNLPVKFYEMDDYTSKITENLKVVGCEDKE
jgi:hypothetical protein